MATRASRPSPWKDRPPRGPTRGRSVDPRPTSAAPGSPAVALTAPLHRGPARRSPVAATWARAQRPRAVLPGRSRQPWQAGPLTRIGSVLVGRRRPSDDPATPPASIPVAASASARGRGPASAWLGAKGAVPPGAGLALARRGASADGTPSRRWRSAALRPGVSRARRFAIRPRIAHVAPCHVTAGSWHPTRGRPCSRAAAARIAAQERSAPRARELTALTVAGRPPARSALAALPAPVAGAPRTPTRRPAAVATRQARTRRPAPIGRAGPRGWPDRAMGSQARPTEAARRPDQQPDVVAEQPAESGPQMPAARTAPGGRSLQARLSEVMAPGRLQPVGAPDAPAEAVGGAPRPATRRPAAPAWSTVVWPGEQPAAAPAAPPAVDPSRPRGSARSEAPPMVRVRRLPAHRRAGHLTVAWRVRARRGCSRTSPRTPHRASHIAAASAT